MILHICAKCNDCCSLSLEDKKQPLAESNDYVPDYMGIGGGDYIILSIELETGKLVDWKTIDPEVLESYIEKNKIIYE